jgi:hypothetical protein
MTSSARARIDCGIWNRESSAMSLSATIVVDGSAAVLDDVHVRLIVSPGAAKDLAALPVRDRRALFVRVEAFAADPFATHPAARPLRGHEDRVRVRHGAGARSAASIGPAGS